MTTPTRKLKLTAEWVENDGVYYLDVNGFTLAVIWENAPSSWQATIHDAGLDSTLETEQYSLATSDCARFWVERKLRAEDVLV